MSRTPYAGPKLPSVLLDKVGGSNTSRKSHAHNVSRKDRRQAERREKNSTKVVGAKVRRDAQRQHNQYDRRAKSPAFDGFAADEPSHNSIDRRKVVKSILKRPPQPLDQHAESSSSEEDIPSKPAVSKAVKSRLAEDDAEIAALERKLGIKNKRSKALEEDGLDWLTNGGEESDSDSPQQKHTRDEDDVWLQNKRRKVSKSTSSGGGQSAVIEDSSNESAEGSEADEEDLQSDQESIENPFSDDELSEGDFGLSDGSESTKPKQQRTKARENPYVAPVSASVAASTKYVPPSLRKEQLDVSEDLSQLRRSLQGQLNRLSDTNFLSILQGIEDIYSKHARQHVSSTLVSLLSELVNATSTLSETFLILYAGFATAVFRVVGPDFTAALLEKLVEHIEQLQGSQQTGKNILNIIGFLSNAYVLQMIGPSIIFSYIKQFLQDLTEDSTELLLRIIRTAGTQLRSDDPTSLKDIVLLLTRTVAARGEANVSVRTKFMIETINDLKNNRMKTNVAGSSIVSEHIVRMRKTLSTLNSRSLRATEPLQVSLEDIKDSEKKGKWWLVGASYHDPAKLANSSDSNPIRTNAGRSIDDGYESDTPGHVSLPKLARSQGMNTDVRRSIFISIMSATDYEDAHNRIAKLGFKNKQIIEVPKVLLHCAGAESTYNPYYTIVARRLCADKRLQKAFQSSLWDVLRRLDIAAHGDQDDELASNMEFSTIVNLGRLFGTLIADECLPLTSLKTVEFSYPSAKLQSFNEVLFTTIMLRCSKKEVPQDALRTVFVQAASAPGMLTGLRVFLERTISTAAIANGAKERKAVKSGCITALESLSKATATSVAPEDEDTDMYDTADD